MADEYQDHTLELIIRLSAAQIGENFVLEHDSASPNVTRMVNNFLKQLNIQVSGIYGMRNLLS